MSNPVAQEAEVPSPEAPEPEAPTTDFAAEATEYKNRFAGSQKKLTETLNQLKALETERNALSEFKTQAERANMSELDALKADLERERQETALARAEAQREKLARKFPQAVEFYGEEALPSEEKLAALQERLAAKPDESEPEPRIDANNPKRTAIEANSDAEWAAMDRYLRDGFGKGPVTS